MKKYFITGTDTDVGKTIASAVLTLALQACYWKPIGCDSTDAEEIQRLSGLSDEHFFKSSYALNAPLSPNQAARLENISISLDRCQLPKTENTLIVEGAGGVFVPLNQNECVIDLMQKLNLPVVIVSRGKLGTINHTLLTIEALRQRGLNIHGIIFNGDLNPDNQRDIEAWGKVRTLLHIPNFENLQPELLQAWTLQQSKKIKENFL